MGHSYSVSHNLNSTKFVSTTRSYRESVCADKKGKEKKRVEIMGTSVERQKLSWKG